MELPKLNLPLLKPKIKRLEDRIQIFDSVRKKYILLTHEEWVRQSFINYLSRIKNYPLALMKIEHSINYNNLKHRADIVVYNNNLSINIIIECKSPKIKITQETFNQISRYNFDLKANFLVVTNGIQHFCCKVDYQKRKINFLKEIPNYSLKNNYEQS
tara:strand:- start:36 stop:509 length:474 start_codon:yes stop_codon:yes gene_type:complete